MPNSNHNRNPQSEERSGVSITLRLSETLFAVCISAGISFGSGLALANSKKLNANCSVQSTSIPHHKAAL